MILVNIFVTSIALQYTFYCYYLIICSLFSFLCALLDILMYSMVLSKIIVFCLFEEFNIIPLLLLHPFYAYCPIIIFRLLYCFCFKFPVFQMYLTTDIIRMMFNVAVDAILPCFTSIFESFSVVYILVYPYVFNKSAYALRTFYF